MAQSQNIKDASREAAQRIFAEVKRSGASPLSQTQFSKIIEEEVVAATQREASRRPRPR